mgnify:CR=1 FL=1
MEDLVKSFSVTQQLNGGAPRNTTTAVHGVDLKVRLHAKHFLKLGVTISSELVSLASNGSQPPCRTLFDLGKHIFFQDIKGSVIFLFPIGVELAAQVQTSQL